jgi:plastocyanin
MKYCTALFVGALLFVQVAAAGEINGKVHAWSAKQPAVVWLEGVKKFTMPTDKPLVAQHKGVFSPAFLVVVAGQTVEMPNQDLVAHNVYSISSSKQFNLGYYAMGEHKEVTFDRPGLVELGCSIHQFMQGRILVVPNPYFALIDAEGAFSIRDLPGGNFLLRFWSNDGRELTRRVIVPPTGVAVVNLDLTPNDVVVRK